MSKSLAWRSLLVVAVLGPALLGACSGPDFVDHVTFVNDSEYFAQVAVTEEQRSGWLELATLRPESTTAIERVIDQGDVWIFRFSYAAKYEDEVRISRRDLQRSEWRVEIPESFAAALRSMRVRPPP